MPLKVAVPTGWPALAERLGSFSQICSVRVYLPPPDAMMSGLVESVVLMIWMSAAGLPVLRVASPSTALEFRSIRLTPPVPARDGLFFWTKGMENGVRDQLYQNSWSPGLRGRRQRQQATRRRRGQGNVSFAWVLSYPWF